ncbi:putative phospholipase B-like 2 [Ornithodoros turicata]|uniref:putative phospholipase B-like 2 n=1 Tax=Ornithodoros turicata TaxID=34597 RepID=UPI003138B250
MQATRTIMTMMLLLLLQLWSVSSLQKSVRGTTTSLASVTWDGTNGRFDVHDGNRSDAIAWGNFTNDINNTGWSYLEIYTNSFFMDHQQAYAAGLVEARLTRDLIKKQFNNVYGNYCRDDPVYCHKLYGYLETNIAFMLNATREQSMSDPYWHQVGLMLIQLAGIQTGMTGAPNYVYVGDNLTPNVSDVLILNLHGDLNDLQQKFNWTGVQTRRTHLGSSSCSAIVKPAPGNEDLYFAHTTWTGYNTMLRILKKYTLLYHTGLFGKESVPGTSITFPSYPGRLFSGDDFYLVNTGLATMETTIGNENAELWKDVKPIGTVQEWIRNMVANRLATTGQEWTTIFSRYNSGTYNNQWMVLDYKRFIRGEAALQNGLLWVLEQIPGTITSADVTSVLREQGYWASYNSPYFPNIFNKSGLPELVERYGDWYSYDRSPRARIFRRDQGTVTDIASLIHLMRYNDFEHDPLSFCDQCEPKPNAENSIAARSDLNSANGTYPFYALTRRPHGATDLKVTTWTLFHKMQFWAISGPTSQQQPPFRWSTSGFDDVVHDGHPDLWEFPAVLHKWQNS